MKSKKQKISPFVTCEKTLNHKYLQNRIVNILQNLFFEIEIYFHIGIPSQFLAILAKVKDEDKLVWELGSIRFSDLSKLSDMPDNEIEEKIKKKVKLLLEIKLKDVESSAEALLEQLGIYSKGIKALGSKSFVF